MYYNVQVDTEEEMYTVERLRDWYHTREHVAAITLLLDQWDSEDTTYPELEELIQNAIPALRDLVSIIRR